ncbi:putative ankyrin repeats [Lyophyllum shimeji]|uniref:Ankyrin repeats n=1 Tax=Lyophyllum shimeji TaxID=47721 RepID=A0A9P3Q257_LYOSH|nr:putative ankyrin repeats [Lyophyllum shimeji]
MPVLDLSKAARSQSSTNDGGLTVTQEMRDILKQPGFIKLAKGGQRLRNLYVDQSMHFQAARLSYFGLCCYVGQLDAVREQVENGRAPDLEGTETPYQFGYATLVVAGAQRVEPNPTTRHLDVLQYLLSRGLPVDVPDIAGLTALHHAVTSDSLQVALARTLLLAGANVDHQNRYGEVALFGAFQKNHVAGVDLLMEFGADLDVKEADGLTPRKSVLTFGPQVTAAVQKWVRKRSGEEAPRVEKRCDGCGKTDTPLKNCSSCHVARYCSVDCQRKAWSEHKKTCQPFSTPNTVTLKPFYQHGQSVIPTKELTNKFFGISEPTPDTHHRSAHIPKGLSSESKKIIIKVQMPYDLALNRPMPGAGPFFIYTKKRDFVCQVNRHDGPSEYDRLAKVIQTKGVGGAKAYFSAELRSKDELVVKISEVLAEQPF